MNPHYALNSLLWKKAVARYLTSLGRLRQLDIGGARASIMLRHTDRVLLLTPHHHAALKLRNMNDQFNPPVSSEFDPRGITRPHSRLLKYYFLISLFAGPAFPLAFLPLLFKYETLRYRFDESGVSMSWGILFRRETYLTYRRIQDIHLTRNIVQRWMGLATVSI